MATEAELQAALEAAAQNPASVSVDGSTVESHPLPDMIEALRFKAELESASKGRRGIRFTKLVSPGSL